MATYTKSLATDFSGNLKSEQLHSEIENSSIVSTLKGVQVTGDVVDIEFNSSLSSGDETILNSLISSHVPDNTKPRIKFVVISPKERNIRSKNYFICSTFRYEGSDTLGLIDYIDIIANKEMIVDSYDVKVVNKSTGQILVEKLGITNDNLETVDLGTISNIPTSPSILELHIRKNSNSGNTNVYIEQIIIYYGN